MQTHLIQIISSLVETPRPEMGLSDKREMAKCAVLGGVENSVLLKCRKLRREDQETSDSIVSRISLFYDMCCYLQSSKISS